jgi:IS4 transposase
MILTTIPENAIAVGDRGFASRELFTEYIKNGVMFVIRINTNWKTGEDGCLDIEQKKVRVVQFYDLETRKEYRIATNISEEIMSNEDIGDVYRKRWEIEVLWKFLKMHLKLDRLATKNINGVTIQIYMILIVYLMLQLVEMPTIYGTKLLDKLRYLQITIRREGNFIHWMNKVASGIEL